MMWHRADGADEKAHTGGASIPRPAGLRSTELAFSSCERRSDADASAAHSS
jgi:hypothetical protein